MKQEFPALSSLLGGETLGIEYKQDLDSGSRGVPMAAETLAGALMAIGNARGGYVLLGVDNAGRISGIHAARSGSSSKLRDEIKRKFAAVPEISSHSYRDAGREVWAFHIEAAVQDPHQLTDGTLRIRRLTGKKQGPENLPFLLADLADWRAQRGIHFDFSSAHLSDLTWASRDLWLNPLAIDRLETRIAAGRTNNPVLGTVSSLEARFEAMELLGSQNGARVATNALLILFGRNEILRERLPGHDAQFQHFGGNGTLLSSLFLGKPGLEQRALLLLAERIEELLRGAVARRELMEHPFRVDIPDYGDDALREATMNAFVHRDFTAPEAIVMQLYPQRFFVSNPGGFYRDVTPQNLLFHEPCPRNRLLAQACADLGLVEKSGRGVDRIFWDQIRLMRPLPIYADTTAETVRLTLPGGETSLEAVRWMMNHFAAVEELSVRLIHGAFLHHLFFEGEATRAALIAALPGLNEEAGRRAITELIDAGLMVRIGHGRGQRLVLSPQLQGEMGQPGAFVHQTGMGEEYRKGMILTLADSQEFIRRSDIMQFLHISEDDAYRLLKKLVSAGELVVQGQRRHTTYRRAVKSSAGKS